MASTPGRWLCVVHMRPHTGTCSDCEAEAKAMNAGSGSSPLGAVTWQTIYDTSATLPEVKPVDPAEQKLLAKVLPKFRGEARCDFAEANEKLRSAPREPHFGVGHERTEQSMRVIKRWVSTNFKDWPVGRFDRQPAQLSFYPRSEDGGDGQYIRAVFECGCC